MMKSYINVLTLILISSCNTNQTKQDQVLKNDTTNKTFSKSNAVSTPFQEKKQLLGIWASENKEPLTVEISEDSIYYTEHFESHKYKLNGDSIYINYPGFVYSGKLYFYKDTLIMESENGKSKYIKFKE